jgi:hypothetical protein
MATTKIPVPAAEERRRQPGGGLVEWVTSVDHKKIGLLHVFTSVAIFLLGGSSRCWCAWSWPAPACRC